VGPYLLNIMVRQTTKLLNQLIAQVHFDKEDKSAVRVAFDNVIKILYEHELIVPQKMYEETLNKVLTEKLVGKAQANEPIRYAIAQAMINTALLLAVSKEEIIKYRIKTNQA
jgi:hypothetical protein